MAALCCHQPHRDPSIHPSAWSFRPQTVSRSFVSRITPHVSQLGRRTDKGGGMPVLLTDSEHTLADYLCINLSVLATPTDPILRPSSAHPPISWGPRLSPGFDSECYYESTISLLPEFTDHPLMKTRLLKSLCALPLSPLSQISPYSALQSGAPASSPYFWTGYIRYSKASFRPTVMSYKTLAQAYQYNHRHQCYVQNRALKMNSLLCTATPSVFVLGPRYKLVVCAHAMLFSDRLMQDHDDQQYWHQSLVVSLCLIHKVAMLLALAVRLTQQSVMIKTSPVVSYTML